jgi:Ca2+-binding EF-hand superfamily protein
MTKKSKLKSTFLGTAVMMLLSTQVTFAQPNGEKNGDMPKKSPLEMFDTDKDNKISYEEAPRPMQENFEKHDLDDNGFIEGDELDTLPKHPPRPKGDNEK